MIFSTSIVNPPVTMDREALNQSNEQDSDIFTFHNILVVIKLDYNSFIIWKYQIMKLLQSLDLEEYVLNDPPKRLMNDGSCESSRRSKMRC